MRLIRTQRSEMDHDLPAWARRSNPIVRQQLGPYWKTIVPDFWFFGRAFALQVVFVILAFPLPLLFGLLMPTVTISLVLLPVAGVLYAHVLARIALMSSRSMADERRNATLDLLRTVPYPLHSILWSKIAASLWRQMEDLNLVSVAAACLSLPVLIIHYGLLMARLEQPFVTELAIIASLGACIIRLLLEPCLVAAFGLAMGAASKQRIPAAVGTLLLSVTYFGFINLARLIPTELPLRLVIEIVLPVALPLLLIAMALRFTSYLIERE